MAFSLNLGALSVALGLDADKFTKGVKEAKSSWGSLRSDLGSLGKGLGAGAALAAGGVALVAKAAMDLETELTKAAAVSQGGMANFADFKKAALDASAGSAASAKQAGESLKFLAMAGFSAKEAMVALPDTIRLASAASVDLGRAADIASDILTGFGLKAADLSHANDVLVLGFTRTNTSLELLAESMKYVGPAAQSSGQSIETMTAAIGLMGNVGVKGSQAGTSLRMALLRMQDPPKKAKAALEALGVQIVDSGGKMRDFVDIIGDMERAQSKFGQADFTSKIGKVVGVEAVSGILGIINQGEGALRSLRDEMSAAKGTTAALEAQMLSTFGGQMQLAQGNVENILSTIGDGFLPVLKELTSWITQTAVALQKDKSAQAEWSKGLTEGLHAAGALVEMLGLMGQVMAFGLGVVGESVRGWQLLVGMINMMIDASAALTVYMLTGSETQLEADRKVIHAQADKLIALGEFGDSLAKTSKIGDQFADSTARVAQILNRSKIELGTTTTAVLSQEEAWQRAAKALREYGAVARFQGEGSNFVESPRFQLLGNTTPKFAGKDTKDPDTAAEKKAAATAAKRRAEEVAQAKIREQIAQMELDALRERYRLRQIDTEAQAAIEGLKLRQLGIVERELAVAQILLDAETKKAAELERQTKELEKQEAARKSAISALVSAGATGGKASGTGGVEAPKKAAVDAQGAADLSRKDLVDSLREPLQLMDSFADMLGDFGGGLKKVIGIGSAVLDGFAEGGAMGALSGGLMALATTIMATIGQSKAFQDNLTVLGGLFDGFDVSSLVDSFFESFQPAIGAVISVFESFGGAGFEAFFESLGRGIFNAVKGVLQAFLFIKKVFAYADLAITTVTAGIVGIVNNLVNKVADWIDRVPGFDRPDTGWINRYNKSIQKEKDDAVKALAAINTQQDNLADLTYESAQAIYNERLERDKSTESLAALNDELKNAPAGFKLALGRFRAQDGARSGGGAQYTTINGALLMSSDPAKILSAIERNQFVRTGSTAAIQNTQIAASVRARL